MALDTSALLPSADIGLHGRHARFAAVSAKPFGGLYGHPKIE
jgi:hypothetical protein